MSCDVKIYVAPDTQLIPSHFEIVQGLSLDEIFENIIKNREQASAVIGRGDLMSYLKKNPDVKKNIASGKSMIVRSGNGVEIDSQEYLESGILVERTPEGNAHSVRLWQDFSLLQAFQNVACNGYIKKLKIPTFHSKNPAVEDDKQTKIGHAQKYTWDSKEENDIYTFLSDEQSIVSEYLDNERVVIFGAGSIGKEVIHTSPFLKNAHITVVDPFLKHVSEISETPHVKSRITISKTIDIHDCLGNAQLVLLHAAGEQEILTKEMVSHLDHAILSNMGRGGNIHPRVLYEGLENDNIAFACLDVHLYEKQADLETYQTLPANKNDWEDGHYVVALRKHPRVLATNHSAGNDVQGTAKNLESAIAAIQDFYRTGAIRNCLVLSQDITPPKNWDTYTKIICDNKQKDNIIDQIKHFLPDVIYMTNDNSQKNGIILLQCHKDDISLTDMKAIYLMNTYHQKI